MDASDSKPRPNSKYRPRTRQKRCYELSFRYLIDDPTWALVHGTCVTHGMEYGHAWLERDGWVYDPVLNDSMPWPEYVALKGAVRLRSYSVVEAAENAAVRGAAYGPWVSPDGGG